MAKVDVIAKASGELEEAVLELMQFVKLCESLDPDSEQPWIALVGGIARKVDLAAHAYVSEIHVSALPHLRDLDRLHVNGGMGAVAPMVTQKAAGQLGSTRT